MKTAIRRHLAGVCLPLLAARNLSPRLIVLMYHAIPATDDRHPDQLGVSQRRFADHLRWLAELQFPVVPLAAGVRQLRQGALTRPVVALTFDDGYQSFYENALPILREHGYPATVFVVPGIMEGQASRDALPDRLGPLFGWSEASRLLRHGVTIGAHTMTHRMLSRLSLDEARREVIDSKRAIEDALGVAVDEFSYPFGSFNAFNRSVEGIVAESGFTAVCSSIAGHNTSPADAGRLKRLRVSWVDDSPAEIRKQCLGAYNWYALVQRAQGF